MSRVDPGAARIGSSTAFSASIMLDLAGDRHCRRAGMARESIRQDTLVFKDLIFPQWWLDWIIPLTSLAMLLQALELLVSALSAGSAQSRHEAVRARARHPAEELP